MLLDYLKSDHTHHNRLFLRRILWVACCIILIMSSPSVFAQEDLPDAPLSSFGSADQKFENAVKEFLNIPYRKGGASKKGIDCSGLARMIYSKFFGIELPHNTRQQFRFSELQKIDDNELQSGDLIFFANKKKKNVNHVGVYLSDGQFIHASSSRGVMISSLDDRYWKARFVGSKRHTIMNSPPDTEEVRFENALEIPVSQNSTITSYGREQFFSNTSALLFDTVSTFGEQFYDRSELRKKHLNHYEIGFDYAISDTFDVNLGAIREKFDPFTAWNGLDSHSNEYLTYSIDDFSSDTSVRHGLKLESGINPNNWLNITPVITYFDYSPERQEVLDGPKRVLGINTLISPEHNRWSLSMFVQCADKGDLLSVPTFDNMLSTLDMEVKLGLNLTDNLQFSITGKHDNRTAAFGIPEDSSSEQPFASHIFLTFDLAN